MNPNNESCAVENGQQPDPAGARNAAMNAKLMLVASHGSGMLIVGAVLLIWTLVRWLSQIGYIDEQKIPSLLIVLMGVALLLQGWWTRRIRSRQGVFAALKGERSWGAKRFRQTLVTMLGAGLVVGLVMAYAGLHEGMPVRGGLVLPMICGVFAVPAFYRAVRLHMWELAVGGVGVLFSGLLFLTIPEGRDWLGFVPMSIGVMLTGLLLHLRWRRWVKALPVDEPGVNTGVVGL